MQNFFSSSYWLGSYEKSIVQNLQSQWILTQIFFAIPTLLLWILLSIQSLYGNGTSIILLFCLIELQLLFWSLREWMDIPWIFFFLVVEMPDLFLYFYHLVSILYFIKIWRNILVTQSLSYPTLGHYNVSHRDGFHKWKWNNWTAV